MGIICVLVPLVDLLFVENRAEVNNKFWDISKNKSSFILTNSCNKALIL